MSFVTKIALSGGPCGGKTRAQEALQKHFLAKGFEVYLIHEVATQLVRAGIPFKQVAHDHIPLLQRNILLLQLSLEDRFRELSQLAKKPVIFISDRSGPDALAYVDDAEQKKILKEEGLVLAEIRDGWYDAVFHMETSAIGAPHCFCIETHEFRNESLEEAVDIDRKQLRLWLGHPHLRYFDNRCSFPEKIQKVIQAAETLAGIPEPVEYERKFVVNKDIPGVLPVDAQSVRIEQYYYRNLGSGPDRLRKRGQDGVFQYYHTVKQDIRTGARNERERRLSEQEFDLLQQQWKARLEGIIVKNRTYFLYDSHYFELDEFLHPKRDFAILECETDLPEPHLNLPPFLPVIREVTGNHDFNNYTLAKMSSIQDLQGSV